MKFTVDAALLRELGERLVGKPHIALAELVKNSYDADATNVVIEFGNDWIEVSDNGHAMSVDDFESNWMRIGTPHKQTQKYSRNKRRPLTGSKGVGRLAVQLLARSLTLTSSTSNRRGSTLEASIDWEAAVSNDLVTEASVEIKYPLLTAVFPGNSQQGTRIRLSGLNQEWTDADIIGLAKEIWPLQPPFAGGSNLDFAVRLATTNESALAAFSQQMHAYLDVWYARIKGKAANNTTNKIDVTITFADGETIQESFISDTRVPDANFEIRIYHGRYRQAHGLKVADVREYLNKFGGVHIYDAGFHLPYYGADTDWLGIERDHSHRLTNSKLLPAHLQTPGGLENLPTQSRIFGVVNINTGKEQASSTSKREKLDRLQIQVSRDRLVDNVGYQALQRAVRWSVDLYAVSETKRNWIRARADLATEPLDHRVTQLSEILHRHSSRIPADVLSELDEELTALLAATRAEQRSMQSSLGLLGALATAGMSALALEHENGRLMKHLELLLRRFAAIAKEARFREDLVLLLEELTRWEKRALEVRGTFVPLFAQENRETRARLRAKVAVSEIWSSVAVLLPSCKIEIDIAEDARLPLATYAEWHAILQNLFTNSANAMLGRNDKRIRVRLVSAKNERSLVVEDTGSGVDLTTASELFEPFARQLAVPSNLEGLLVGGTGLGLTIVRMVTSQIGVRVRFVPPSDAFSTAAELSWKESTK